MCIGLGMVVGLSDQVVSLGLGLHLSMRMHYSSSLQILCLCCFLQRLCFSLKALRLHRNLHSFWLRGSNLALLCKLLSMSLQEDIELNFDQGEGFFSFTGLLAYVATC